MEKRSVACNVQDSEEKIFFFKSFIDIYSPSITVIIVIKTNIFLRHSETTFYKNNTNDERTNIKSKILFTRRLLEIQVNQDYSNHHDHSCHESHLNNQPVDTCTHNSCSFYRDAISTIQVARETDYSYHGHLEF